MGGKARICAQEKEFNAAISERIERLRIESCETEKALAAALGVMQQVLYSYEVGIVRWPSYRLWLAARFFRVPLDQIVPESKHYIESPCRTRKSA